MIEYYLWPVCLTAFGIWVKLEAVRRGWRFEDFIVGVDFAVAGFGFIAFACLVKNADEYDTCAGLMLGLWVFSSILWRSHLLLRQDKRARQLAVVICNVFGLTYLYVAADILTGP